MNIANQSQATTPPWWPLSDEPTDDDQLGFKGYCERVAEGLKRCRSEGRSLTVGVYGKWGSGKTSFLKMLGRELEDSHTIVWFEAWQYSRREELWVALLRKILATIEREHKQAKALRLRLQVWYDVKKKGVLPALAEPLWPMVWKAIAIVLWLSLVGWLGLAVLAVGAVLGAWRRIILGLFSLAPLVAVGLLGKWGLNAILGSQLGVKMEQLIGESSYASFIAFLDEFRRDFNDLVREVGQERPPVILIDDLDRCQPDEIVPVLEAIKVLAGQGQEAQDTQQSQEQACCAFVLAMDRDVAEQAIEVHYEDFVQDRQNGEAGRPISGQRYLEKIVQLPIPLPPLTSVNARDFIEQLVDDEEINRYQELFARGLEPTTPRQIKRVLNAFAYHRSTLADRLGKKQEELRSDLVAKVVVIQHKWRDLYEMVPIYSTLLEDLESYFEVSQLGSSSNFVQLFALSVPTDSETLSFQFGRDASLADLILWPRGLTKLPKDYFWASSFADVPDLRSYLIRETRGAQSLGPAEIWSCLMSGDEIKIRSAQRARGGLQEVYSLFLLHSLESKNANEQEKAITAFAALPDTAIAVGAVAPLSDIASNKRVPFRLRVRAAHALGRMPTEGILQLFGHLLTAGDEDLMMRLIAADALSSSEVRAAKLDGSTGGDFLSDLLNIVELPPPGQPRSQSFLLDLRVRRLLGTLGNRDDTVIDRVIDWIFEVSAAGEERRSLVALDILRRVEPWQLTPRLVFNMVERHPDHRAVIEEIL